MSENEPLSEVIAHYLQAVDEGNPLADPDIWLGLYPEHADELRRFFAGQGRVERIAAPLREMIEPAPDKPDLPRLFGEYELLEEIGRGGMGVVYRARQAGLDRVVAVKMLTGSVGGEQKERLAQEARLLAELEHPNIVPVYTVGEHEGRLFFAMKLIEGGNLAERLAELSSILPEAVALLVHVARAVHFAHEKGVLHRDIKPANILLDANDTPLLTDFGLARHLDQSHLTQTGAVVGTPLYMAPEQAAGATNLTAAVDVYALGMILYEILTGQLPFAGTTPLEVLHQVVAGVRTTPRRLVPRVDRELERVCLCCLARRPEDRYPSGGALADDLERWLDDSQVHVVSSRKLAALGRHARGLLRHRWLIVWLTLVALVLWALDREGRSSAEVERAEFALARGRPEVLLQSFPTRPSWVSWLGPYTSRSSRDRLREVTAEHLFGPINWSKHFPQARTSPGTWTWSDDGRFVGLRRTESRRHGRFDTSWAVVWDGWTGAFTAEPCPEPAAFGSARSEIDWRTIGARKRWFQELREISNNDWFSPPGPPGWPAWISMAISSDSWLLPGDHIPRKLPVRPFFDWRQTWISIGHGDRTFLMPVGGCGRGTVSSEGRFLHFGGNGMVPVPIEALTPIPDRSEGTLIQATYDITRKCWIRLVGSDLTVYLPPLQSGSGSFAVPPSPQNCVSAGRPRLLSTLQSLPKRSSTTPTTQGWLEREGATFVDSEFGISFVLSPDGTRLLSIGRDNQSVHVWRMPGSDKH